MLDVAQKIRPLKPPAGSGQQDNSTKVYPWRAYLREFLANPNHGAEYADVIGLHPYRSQQDAHDDRDFALSVYDQIYDARGIRKEYDAQDPFWVTEVGVSAGGTGPTAVAGETEQAKKLTTVYTKLRELGVPTVVIHRMVNTTSGTNAWSDNIGVLGSSFGRKPAYCSLAAARGYSLCQ